MSRAAELARSRAFHGLTEDDCEIWFGVGIATLERIEAGEVEPSEELERRIVRFLNAVGGGGSHFSVTPPRPQPAHGGGLTGGGTASLPRGPAANFENAPLSAGPIHPTGDRL